MLLRPRLKSEEKLILVALAVAAAVLWASRSRVPI
jgi:lambda repressor-like predicted transcriptional regulator